MSSRAEHSWLTLLLPVAICVLLIIGRTAGTKDSNLRDDEVTPDVTEQIAMSHAGPVVPPQVVPPAHTKDVFPGSSVESIDKEGARGLNELGVRYFNGTSVQRDLDAAYLYFSVAAGQGDVSATNNLGRMYEEGWGTEPDRNRALELYARAALLGSELARDNLQRLRAAISKADRPIDSAPRKKAAVIAVLPNEVVARLGSAKPKTISVTEHDTGRKWADTAKVAIGSLSAETVGSTGTIAPADLPAASMPGSMHSQKETASLPRKDALQEAVDAPGFGKSYRPEATSTTETKMLTKPKPRKSEASRRPGRSRNSTTALGKPIPATTFFASTV
jgi:Sel1 repeat